MTMPTPETNPITEEDIKRGFMLGWVRIGKEHHGANADTVCYIGSNWFYFGGMDAESEGPYEYVTNHDFDEIVRDIVEVVNELAEPYETSSTPNSEWLYYRYLLNND